MDRSLLPDESALKTAPRHSVSNLPSTWKEEIISAIYKDEKYLMDCVGIDL